MGDRGNGSAGGGEGHLSDVDKPVDRPVHGLHSPSGALGTAWAGETNWRGECGGKRGMRGGKRGDSARLLLGGINQNQRYMDAYPGQGEAYGILHLSLTRGRAVHFVTGPSLGHWVPQCATMRLCQTGAKCGSVAFPYPSHSRGDRKTLVGLIADIAKIQLGNKAGYVKGHKSSCPSRLVPQTVRQ